MPSPWIDDGSIPDETVLWRAIPHDSLRDPDPLTGDRDVSDSIFRTHELSVYINAEMEPGQLAAKSSVDTQNRP